VGDDGALKNRQVSPLSNAFEGEVKMRCLAAIFLTLLLIASAQSQGEISKTNLPSQLATIAKHLRKAQSTKSLTERKSEILKARKLIAKMPPSLLTYELENRLNKALSLNVKTKNANMLLNEATEIAENANKLLMERTAKVDPEAAKATLMRVLSDPEFRNPWEPILKLLERLEKPLVRFLNWLGRVFSWFGAILRPVFEWISAILQAMGVWFWHWLQLLMKISPILAWTIIIAFGAIVLVSLAYAILKWWRQRQKLVAESVIAEKLVMPEQLLKEAETAAKKGDYLTAIRKAYKALLLSLDRIGLIRFREQRTNWEYLAEIQRKAEPNFVRQFREITHTFDLCFYARKFATAKEYTTVRQFAEELLTRALPTLSSSSS